MSDGPKLTTEFITTSDPKGAQQTAEAIKGVKAAAEEAAPAQKELTDSTKQNTDATEKGTGANKAAAEGLRAVRSELPIVGRLLDLLKSPWAALGAVIAVVTNHMRELFQKLNESESHWQRVMQNMRDVDATMGKMNPRWIEAARNARVFTAEMNEAATATKSASQVLADLNELLAEQQRLNAERDSFEKAGMLAAIEADANLSPDEKSKRKAAVERQFAEAQRNQQQQAQWQLSQSQLAASRAADERQGDARFQMKDAIEASVAARNEADKAEILATGTAADFEKRAPGMLEQQRKSQSAIAELKEKIRMAPAAGPTGGDPKALLTASLEEEKKRLAEHEAAYDRLVRENAAAKANARLTGFKAEDAEGVVGGLRKTIRESTTERDDLRKSANKTASGVLRGAMADPNSPRSQSPALAGRGAAELASAGGKMDEAAGEITRVATGLNTAISGLEVAIKNMSGGSEIKAVSHKLSQIERDLSLLRSQFKNSRE